MVRLISCDNVDGLFILNFYLDRTLIFFPGHKDLYFLNIIVLMGTTLYSAHLMEPLQLNLDHGRNMCV